MNYELIYRARSMHESVRDARQKKYAAEAAFTKAEATFKTNIATLLGKKTDEIDFTTEMCLADGIPNHVYNKAYAHGVGHRKCFFCGCDDFDGF